MKPGTTQRPSSLTMRVPGPASDTTPGSSPMAMTRPPPTAIAPARGYASSPVYIVPPVRVNAGETAVEFVALDAVACEIGIACSDETTALTTGLAKVTFRMPYAMSLTAVRANVNTAPTTATIIVDINEATTSILSTKLSIDATEFTSTTAATPAVISDGSLADDAEITIDIDQVGSTIAGKGLKVWLIGTRA